MDKLTSEQKAKAYDLAIEKLRNAFYGNNSRMCEEYRQAVIRIIEPIFPELAEPEDERIRKAIIEQLKSRGQGSFAGYPMPTILAWLEKQGQTFTKKEVDDAYLAGVRDTKQELEKQGEQKPVNIDIDKMVEDYANDKEYGNEGFGKPNCMIRAYRQGLTDAIVILNLRRQGEQKPAWSDEDDKMVNNILTPLAGRFPWNIYQPMYDWLKALKERIGGIKYEETI